MIFTPFQLDRNAIERSPARECNCFLVFAFGLIRLMTPLTFFILIYQHFSIGLLDHHLMVVRYYRAAVGALLVYDITKHLTYENVDRWLKV